MKTAEEWYSEHILEFRLFNHEESTPEEFIRAIQRDALKAAAEKCLEIADYSHSPALPFPLPGVNAAMGCRSLILALIPEEKQK